MPIAFERLKSALADRYRIDRELGHGGMATVFLALDTRHSRPVAIKVMKPDVAAALGAERFLREIAVTARLDHPHILPLLDSGNADGFLYYAMPFVDGESLRNRIDRERQLPIQEALAITRDIAGALNYAHGLGIIHRDVKPENILLAGGHARLADFGIARAGAAADDVTGSPSLTATGLAIGTAVYMSPEQATAERNLDRRTDIYSLAAVTYEMLAGQPPHTGATANVVLTRKLREAVSSLRTQRETVPPAIDTAICRALARLPADRFSTAQEFADALGSVSSPADPPPVVHRPGTDNQQPTLAVDTPRTARRRRFARYLRLRSLLTGVLLLGVGGASWWWLQHGADARWLEREALPQIEQYLDVADFESAYALANEIKRRVPESRDLAELWPRLSWRVTIPSEPSGARVFRQAYNAPPDTWEELGTTPLVDIRFPYGLSRIRFELDGYRPLVRALGGAHLNWAALTAAADNDTLLVGPETFMLETEKTLPPDMVRVTPWKFADGPRTLDVSDFLIGRFEVTNADYKKFVVAGGYGRRELWDPMMFDGRTLAWEEGMRRFVDRTGQPGPSTWSAGDYPDGQDAFPVSGVSWYEAAAYARFVDRELPTAHHWQRALANSMFPWLLPASDFGGQGPRPVTEGRAMSHVGAFDMTGNVREWTATAIGNDRIILGGSWNDPYYIAGVADTSAPPADRSAGNGIRLAVTHDEPAVATRLRAPFVSRTIVSAGAEQAPASDAVYTAYGRLFDYRRGPLNASVDSVERTRLWIRERVALDAGYGDERMLLHLYLPTTGTPPYQAVVYWPGWDTFALDDIDEYFAKQVDFIVKSGRALAFPIYKGTFERRVGQVRRMPDFNTAEYRDNVIDGVKDLRRSLDYLATRSEIDSQALAFFGYSWGGVNGPIALAQEPRFRTAVIDIGLLPPLSATPEVDPVNALPRVRQPTVMFSGEFDPMVPAANAKRYFDLIGAPASDKRHVIAVGGHFIPRDLLIREVLDWLDKHLGRPGR